MTKSKINISFVVTPTTDEVALHKKYDKKINDIKVRRAMKRREREQEIKVE